MKNTKDNVPKLKKFWQRAIFYFVISMIFGLAIGWILSSYDPSQLVSGTGRRRTAVRLMLSLMSPISWGFVIFNGMFLIGIIGDWYSYRFKNLAESLPVMKSSE